LRLCRFDVRKVFDLPESCSLFARRLRRRASEKNFPIGSQLFESASLKKPRSNFPMSSQAKARLEKAIKASEPCAAMARVAIAYRFSLAE
jgi:hypothetical protein